MTGGAPQPALPGPSTTSSSPSAEPRAPRPGYNDLLQPDDKELIRRVEERINYQGRDAARWAMERQMFENIAFIAGIHWIEYTESTRRFQRWNAPSWFPTPVTNAIAPRLGKMVSAILRSEPQGKVRPDTNDPADRHAAKVGEQVLGHIYDVSDEETLRQFAAIYAGATGTVIAEDNFNPQAGKILRVPRTSLQEKPVMMPAAQCPGCGNLEDPEMSGMACPMCQTAMGDGQRQATRMDGSPATMPDLVPELDPVTAEPIIDEVREGEFESRAMMPFNFYWDQKARTLKEARWCGETVYADLDWIDENFPDNGPFVGAESGIDGANFYESSILALVGPSMQGTAHYGGQQFFTNGAVLRRYQEKPSSKYPNGLYAIVANGVILHKGDLTIQDENGRATGDFTYTEFRYDILPGRFLGRTPTDDLVPQNKRVNGIDAQIVLNRKTLLSPWILAPKGSGLNPGVVAMRPGATIVFNFVGVGTSPQVVQGTPLPAQIYTEREQAMLAMDQLIEESIQQNNQPEGMRSGIAFNLASELLEAVKLPRRKRWALWIRDRDRKRLLMAQRFYREPRVVKIMGEGTDYQVRMWSGADLRGNTDVTVDWGSLQPRSPSLKSQMVFDAIEAGLIDITNPIHKQKALEELGLGGFELAVGPDRRRAEKENASLDDGVMVPINDYDDNDIHALVHSARIKEPSFDQLPPEAQAAHKQHLQLHEQAQAQEKQALETEALRKAAIAAAMGGAAKGAPPPFVGGDIAIGQQQAQPPPPPPPPGPGGNGNGAGVVAQSGMPQGGGMQQEAA